MEYTRKQYEEIVRDITEVLSYLKYAEEGQKEPFQCVRTDCIFCPFRDSMGRCLDLLSPIGTPTEKWNTARTAAEWQEWLERFKPEIDPKA